MTVLMAVEGVLRKENGDPIPEGFKLYRTLLSSYRIVLSVDEDLKKVDHWLKTNYLFDYADVFTDKDAYNGQELRLRHLDLVKQGEKLELFIDSDPDTCAAALAGGVPTLLFSTPKHFQTHRDLRPWDVITKEQERQKALVAERYLKYLNTEGQRWE